MEVDDATEISLWSEASRRTNDNQQGDHSSTLRKSALSPMSLTNRAVASSAPQVVANRKRDFTEELAELLVEMCPSKTEGVLSGKDLAEAFRDASDTPPVTRQSLGELDIQSITSNIRLRHDVNFDRDLSFRPNLDGIKGQEKGRVAKKYWTALAAELILYQCLYQGTPPLRSTDWEQVNRHVQRRIPILFRTVREVLKSLVPERDHSRVDEHLDVPLLMQAIEKGVCDLVRLAEWMAQLLKEHCAPMRDAWVDAMVESVRSGVSEHCPEKLVEGLRELLGILEAMKLDVANHQIRNLKTRLVEDTINFERRYHLDRLVHGRPRVNINAAQTWFASAVEQFRHQCASGSPKARSFQLEVFVRAITSVLFHRDRMDGFPDTLYLDHERLRSLKAEIEDLICFDICMDLFTVVAREFGYTGSISLTTGQQLRNSLSAIMNDVLGHGSQQWIQNSEDLSLEILRQASRLTGHSQGFHFDILPNINQRLHHLLLNEISHHGRLLEASVLPQILTGAQRHITSSPMELFNNLVSTSYVPPPPAYVSPLNMSDTFTFAHLHPEVAKMTDLANRITHIIVLHWRVWDRIAYVPEEESHSQSLVSPATIDSSMTPIARTLTVQPSSAYDQDSQVVASMKTGDAPESGTEAHVARQTSSQ